MRIVLSCVHFPVASGRFLYWALRRLGHEVVTVGPAVGMYLPWAQHRNLEPYEWKPDLPVTFEPHKLLSYGTGDTLARAGFVPDLIIQIDAQFVLEGKAPCPSVLWAIDNHVAKYGEYDTFDRIYIAHSWGYMHDLPHARFLPCAHDPQHHYVMGGAPRSIEVGMVGAGYESRQDLLEKLKAARLRVKGATGLVYGEYNTFYNQCQIALVKSTGGDLAMRVFENMAQGCLVLADRASDMAKVGLVEGVHYLGYDSAEECVAKARYALVRWEEMQPMIAAAREWVKPHTWEARAQVILDECTA